VGFVTNGTSRAIIPVTSQNAEAAVEARVAWTVLLSTGCRMAVGAYGIVDCEVRLSGTLSPCALFLNAAKQGERYAATMQGTDRDWEILAQQEPHWAVISSDPLQLERGVQCVHL
jgi:hypothetical protein